MGMGVSDLFARGAGGFELPIQLILAQPSHGNRVKCRGSHRQGGAAHHNREEWATYEMDSS